MTIDEQQMARRQSEDLQLVDLLATVRVDRTRTPTRVSASTTRSPRSWRTSMPASGRRPAVVDSRVSRSRSIGAGTPMSASSEIFAIRLADSLDFRISVSKPSNPSIASGECC